MTKLARWGNSLAVRLPRSLVEELALKDGDEVIVRPDGAGGATIQLDRSRAEALAALGRQGWTLPAGYALDREEISRRGKP